MITSEPWHRVESEEQLEHLVRAGWTEYTLRPYGSTEYIFLDEQLFDKQLAQLCLSNFATKQEPYWITFRDIVTAIKLHQVCVPGPLNAHELAMLEVGKQKTKEHREALEEEDESE